ncbi:MAG TPA: NAD-dependent epimerase/dehydratase family protein, partial [Myxococcota bacterium]|nr:NAD-dependent epimerase/dehydratase family protein [Myxococcota bacterium]
GVPNVQRVYGDVLKPKTLTPLLRGADVVFHLAAKVNIEDRHDTHMDRVNVRGTLNVLRACKKLQTGRLVHCSSVHSLRHGPEVHEYQPLVKRGDAEGYDLTKARGEAQVLRAVRRQGLDAVVVNPTGMIGPHDYHGSALGKFFRGQWKYMPAVNGAYDMVDVRDACRGMLLAAQRGRTGERYILGGHWVRVPDLMMRAQEASGERAWFVVPWLGWPVTLPWTLASWSVPLVRAAYQWMGWEPVLSRPALAVLQSTQAISHHKAALELGYDVRPLAQTIRDIFAWQREHHLHR